MVRQDVSDLTTTLLTEELHVLVEKENGDWVWARSRKKAFDVHTPTRNAPTSCKVAYNFAGLCNIQWKSDQLTANRGMPVFG